MNSPIKQNHFERIGHLAALRHKVFGLQDELSALMPGYVEGGGGSVEGRLPWACPAGTLTKAGEELDELLAFLVGAGCQLGDGGAA